MIVKLSFYDTLICKMHWCLCILTRSDFHSLQGVVTCKLVEANSVVENGSPAATETLQRVENLTECDSCRHQQQEQDVGNQSLVTADSTPPCLLHGHTGRERQRERGGGREWFGRMRSIP